MLKIDKVTKKFGDTVAVDDLSLEIKQGECFVFLGPNGAGKTTTIKMLTGLLRPTEGCIHVAGFDMSKDPLKAKQKISYIPDVPYLYDKLSGWEFLQFIGVLFGLSKTEINARIKKLVGMFGLERYQYQLTEDYSHGLRQRLVICAALIHDPELIIVDEPMVALDPLGIRLVKDVFRERIKQGATIFMSTHTLSVAEEMASRIGIINHGRLIALGTKSELQKRVKKEGGVELEEVFLELTSS